MEELKQAVRGIHTVNLTGRKNCLLTGVKDVINFDEREVSLETEQGSLFIKGNGLHVTRLTLEHGEVDIDGQIDSMAYSDHQGMREKGESVLSRLFR